MSCPLCQTSGSFIAANDRRCAFGPDGRFRPENLHCGTMDAILGCAAFKVVSGHLHTAILSGPDGVIVLAWRGSMARIGYATVLVELGDAIAVGELDLATAQKFLEAKARRPA